MNTPSPHYHRRDACYASVWSTLKVQKCERTTSLNEVRAAPILATATEQLTSPDTHHRFEDIVGHFWAGTEYFFEVRWENGEVTREPMSNLKQDDPRSLAEYLNHSGLAKRSKTCSWANDDEYMSGSSSEEEAEELEPKQRHNPKDTIIESRSYGLRSGSRNGGNIGLHIDEEVDEEGLTEEQILCAKRRKRRAQLNGSREERRVRRKIEKALDLASKCAEFTKLADEEGVLLHMLGQLGNDSNIGSFEQSSEDKLFRCPVCLDPFDSLLSDLHLKRDSNLPVRSAVCSHKLCCSCLTHMQLANSSGASVCKWLKCPVCKQNTAFDAVSMPIDVFVCQCMDRIEAKTYTLSAAISLSSDQHRTVAGLYARASKGSNLKRLSSDQSSKKLLAAKRKLAQSQKAVKRKSEALKVVEEELVSTKGELAHARETLKQWSCEANEANDDVDTNETLCVKEDLLALRPSVARAKLKYQEKYRERAENWFGRLEDLIGSSVAVIGDYEARERVERAKKEVLMQENARLASEISELKTQLQARSGHSKRCNSTSVLEDII